MTVLSTPKGEVSIRVATTEDAPSLYRLRLEALTTNPEAFAADADKAAANGVEAWMQRIEEYSQAQSGVITVASVASQLVGMTGLARGNSKKTRHSAILWGVYVSPAWRRFHIAEAILGNMISWSRDQGLIVLKLGVLTVNEPAIACYRHCGFSIYGLEPKSNYFDGIYYDEYLMARLISD
jgi:RimJ/RimL family protein N-acetyltransferase